MEILIQDEYKRKGIHLLALVIPIGFYLTSQKIALAILILAALISLLMDFIRILELPGHRLLGFLLSPLLRSHEDADLTGGTYILFASVVTIYLFNKHVALAALGFIIVGDICSALVGRKFGRVRFFDKSLEGSLGFLLACLVVAVAVPHFSLVVGMLGAITATFVEAFEFNLDDNLVVPLVSGGVMQLLVNLLDKV